MEERVVGAEGETAAPRVQPASTPVQAPVRPLLHWRFGSIPWVMLILFFLFLQTSHNGDEFLARHQYQDALQSLTLQLGNYTAWLNGTASNFTMVSLLYVVVCMVEKLVTTVSCMYSLREILRLTLWFRILGFFVHL
jgi:hypothetical protein